MVLKFCLIVFGNSSRIRDIYCTNDDADRRIAQRFCELFHPDPGSSFPCGHGALARGRGRGRVGGKPLSDATPSSPIQRCQVSKKPKRN